MPTKLSNVKQWPTEIESDPQLIKLVEKNDIVLKDSVFVRADDNNNIIVVPKSLHYDVLKMLIDDFDDPGIKKTLSRVKEILLAWSCEVWKKNLCMMSFLCCK